MTNFDNQYKNLVKNILSNIQNQEVRGERTIYLLNQEIFVDLQTSWPALTLRDVYPASALKELRWLLTGHGDISKIKSPAMKAIWSHYANPAGIVQFSYYSIWRDYNNFDQLANIVKRIKNNYNDRSLVVNMYNPEWSGVQPPCQSSLCFTATANELNLTVFARSADVIFGLVSDIQVYAGLLEIIAQLTGKVARKLSFFMVNAHIYEQHLGVATRLIGEPSQPPARVKINNVKDDFTFDFEVVNYHHNDFNMQGAQCALGDLDFYKLGKKSNFVRSKK